MSVDFEKLLRDIDPAFRKETAAESLKHNFPQAMGKIAPAIWCYLFHEAQQNKDNDGVNASMNAGIAAFIYFGICLKGEEADSECFKRDFLQAVSDMLDTAMPMEKEIKRIVPQTAGGVGLQNLLSFANDSNIRIINELAEILSNLTDTLKDRNDRDF